MRFSSRSCGSTLRILRLYLKVAIFQPELQEHAPRTTFVLKSCDFQAGAAADQGGIEPATAGLRKQARKPRDNFQRPFREQQNRTALESASTLTISAEGSPRLRRVRSATDARSPQRVHPGMSKTHKKSSFCTSTTPTPAFAPRPRRSPQRVHPGIAKTQKKPRVSPCRSARDVGGGDFIFQST